MDTSKFEEVEAGDLRPGDIIAVRISGEMTKTRVDHISPARAPNPVLGKSAPARVELELSEMVEFAGGGFAIRCTPAIDEPVWIQPRSEEPSPLIEQTETTVKTAVTLRSCNECRHRDHSGAFTPGGAKPVCGHSRAPHHFPRVTGGKGFWDWKHRVIPDPSRIPSCCPLRNGEKY